MINKIIILILGISVLFLGGASCIHRNLSNTYLQSKVVDHNRVYFNHYTFYPSAGHRIKEPVDFELKVDTLVRDSIIQYLYKRINATDFRRKDTLYSHIHLLYFEQEPSQMVFKKTVGHFSGLDTNVEYTSIVDFEEEDTLSVTFDDRTYVVRKYIMSADSGCVYLYFNSNLGLIKAYSDKGPIASFETQFLDDRNKLAIELRSHFKNKNFVNSCGNELEYLNGFLIRNESSWEK